MSQIGILQDASQTAQATTAAGLADQHPAAGSGTALPPLPTGLSAPATYSAARASTAQTIPQATNLRGTAAPGKSGFFAAIGNWFRGLFASGSIPAQVTVQMPGGGTVNFDGKSLESLVNALPISKRPAAVANLERELSQRIANGKSVYDSAVNGSAMNPNEQDVADMMLYIKAKAMATGHAFTNVSFSIEDPQGALARFLDSCPGRYQRSSTHLNELQAKTVDGHLNTHRGIDFAPQGMLPGGQSTVLYGTIPQFGSQPRRIFIKTETYGARISTLSSASKAQGLAEGSAGDRGVRLRDVGQAISHLGRLIRSKFVSKGGSKTERIPNAVKRSYAQILGHWKQAHEGVHGILTRDAPLSRSGGIRAMLANLDAAAQNIRGNRQDFPQADADIDLLMQQKASLIQQIPDKYQLESRIGNEVMFSQADL